MVQRPPRIQHGELAPQVLSKPSAGVWPLVGLLLLSFFIALDASMPHIALYEIALSLEAPQNAALSLVEAYGIAVGLALLLGGALSDYASPRLVTLLGISGFVASLTLVIQAITIADAENARILAGVSAAALTTSSIGSLRKRGGPAHDLTVGIVCWTVGFALGTATGPAIGGLILNILSWQAVFILPGASIIVLGLALVPSIVSRPVSLPDARLPKSNLDAAPVVSVLVASVAGMAFLELRSAAVVGLVAILFLVMLRSGPRQGSRRHLQTRGPLIGCICALVTGMAAVSGIWYGAIKVLQFGTGLSPAEAGLAMAIPAGVQVGSGLLLLCPAIQKRCSLATALGGLLAITALACAALSQDNAPWSVILAVAGINAGLTPLAIFSAEKIVRSFHESDAGLSIAISESSAELGFAGGLVLFGNLTNLLEVSLAASYEVAPVDCQWHEAINASFDIGARCGALYGDMFFDLLLIIAPCVLASTAIAVLSMRRHLASAASEC
ncbi:MFS transporter [Stutzerimonas nitrititolerans]|uniref:MFS transporter n=1 Tax=Stutzerimonas nitrititolerans TaxID=2482751 RepID=UPI0028B0029A|nr:MFS transporter [Stutzerimonas nitrititolerans]